MKFSCYKSDLTEALAFVIRAVAVKPMTPILAGIYLKAEGSMLELQANNFSTGIITRIPVNTEVPGEMVVSGKRFQDFIRSMPDDTITISDDGSNNLTIDSGGASADLLTMSAVDFPKVKTPETDNTFKIRTTALRDLIRKTVFAVAKDESRPVFTGVCFEIKDGKISLIATNTHRLALASAPLSEPCNECSFVVPAETLRGLLARLDPKDMENYITINYSTRYLTFTFDNVFVNSRLIEGTFPPYDRVIPAESTTQVKVKTAEFKAAAEFVAIISKENEYNTARFVFADGGVEISSNSPEIGGANQAVEAQISGDELEISFNIFYIADVMKVVDTPNVTIELNDRYSPAKFIEPGNDSYIYIATPVRT